jgi:ABC-2 type transport system ATP-binding protein
MKPILSLNAVTRRFGDRLALDGLSLSLHPGDVFALLGPNGAGKTTTLNIVLGFLQPDAGTVVVCGQEVVADPARARQSIAYLPEQVAIYPELSGLENLRYFSLLASIDLREAEMRELLKEAGLAEEAHDRAARGYSKGMRQKVGISIAMARQARLLLLDEPTSGLDPSAASELSSIIRSAAGRGIAVLMATHDLYRLKEVANRVGVLHGGKIAREIDPRTVDHVALEQLYIEQFAQ